ncbi:hypothetical protein [Methylopila sp. M107]|uniref:hypothetical protein n=1 Tax=Methylopila sp. M107 TaxID=1101190 RepID=UPI000363EA51|nr:hypothetical protein [Methylopila sp. M107]
MSNVETHMSETPSRTPAPGAKARVEHEVEAKQGTDKPKGMPIVLLVSTVGAAVALFAVWTIFFV